MKEIYQLEDFLTISMIDLELKIFLNYLPKNLHYTVPFGTKRLTLKSLYNSNCEYDESKVNLEMLPETLEFLEIEYLDSKIVNNLPKSLKALHFDSLIINGVFIDELNYLVEMNNDEKILIPPNITQLCLKDFQSLSCLKINHYLEKLIVIKSNLDLHSLLEDEDIEFNTIREFIVKNNIGKTYLLNESKFDNDFNDDELNYQILSDTPMDMTTEIFKLWLEYENNDQHLMNLLITKKN